MLTPLKQVTAWRIQIYNSRNLYVLTPEISISTMVWMIYNSRNFICIYTRRAGAHLRQGIYNSRNFICIYTYEFDAWLRNLSTIVEISYVFTPTSRAVLFSVRSTIVEISYVFTPDDDFRPQQAPIYNSRNFICIYT